MCFQLRDALRVGCIMLYRGFVCLTMTNNEIFKMISDEMRNFCILIEAPRTPFGKIKKTYSGKVGGRNDDIVIAMYIAKHTTPFILLIYKIHHSTFDLSRKQATRNHRLSVFLSEREIRVLSRMKTHIHRTICGHSLFGL